MFFFLIYIALCIAVGYVGRYRRIGIVGCSVAAFLFTPLLTLIVLLLTTDHRAEARHYDAEGRHWQGERP